MYTHRTEVHSISVRWYTTRAGKRFHTIGISGGDEITLLFTGVTLLHIRGDLEVSIRNMDSKISGYMLYTCVYPGPFMCTQSPPLVAQLLKNAH